MEKELIQQQELQAFQPKTPVCFISRGCVVNVKYEEITHLSKYGNETVVYTVDNSYRTYNSLQEILKGLPVNDFFRVHRLHVVSLKWMEGVIKKKIAVGEFYLPVSECYKVSLLASLKEKLDREYFFYEENTSKIYEPRL